MTSYLEPVPAIPTLSPTNIYPEEVQPLENQIDQIYTDVSNVMGDKKRSDTYLQTEDITNDIWTTSVADEPVPIYRKTIPTGVLAAGPNTIPHGISQFGTLVDIRVMVSDGTNQRKLGYASPTPGDCASVDTDATNVVIFLGGTFGVGYEGYIIMEYT